MCPRTSKRALARSLRPASRRAAAIPPSEKSKPVNHDRGNAAAIILNDQLIDPATTHADADPPRASIKRILNQLFDY